MILVHGFGIEKGAQYTNKVSEVLCVTRLQVCGILEIHAVVLLSMMATPDRVCNGLGVSEGMTSQSKDFPPPSRHLR
jgi:hypothetical protein